LITYRHDLHLVLLQAVASSHLSRQPLTVGSLADGKVVVKVGGKTLAAAATTAVSADQDLAISVEKSGGGVFKGVLIRIEEPNNAAPDFEINPNGLTTKDCTFCLAPVQGITHNSAAEKTSVSGTLSTGSPSTVTVDVTVVDANNDIDGSTYWYSQFKLQVNAAPAPKRCFSGDSTVDVKGQGETAMRRVKVGDEVLTAQGLYSKIYSFSHKQESAVGTYLQILTEAMHKSRPLEITPNHLIYVFDESHKATDLKFAQDVVVGDFLVTTEGLPSRVDSIRTVTSKQGLYTPITESGDILVNGVLASSYTSVDCLEGFASEQNLHRLSHGAMAPYRLYCAISGGCQDETYDEMEGLNPWISFLSGVQHALLNSPSFVVKASIVLISATPFIVFVVLGNLLTTSTVTLVGNFVMFALGYFVWKKTANKMKLSDKATTTKA